MSKITFSIVIPTRHRNDLLGKCLDRLKPGIQTLSADEYEVIVTDDGSTSTAQEMIDRDYPWVKWVAGPRKGPAANRNNGARHAQAEWLVFTDDDCLPSRGWLEAYAASIVPEVQVYEGKTTCDAGLSSPLETSPLNTVGGYLWSCNMMIKTTLHQSLGGFDEGFPSPCHEDTELRERIKRNGYVFNFVPDAVIDHPPRPQLRYVKMGKRAESSVRLWYATGHKKPRGYSFVWSTLIFRLREIKQAPIGLGSLVWFFSTLVEITYISFNLRKWNLKHHDAYSKVI